MVTPFSRHFGHFVVAAEHAAQCLGVCGSARVFASPRSQRRLRLAQTLQLRGVFGSDTAVGRNTLLDLQNTAGFI
jgi:hypothetical protein